MQAPALPPGSRLIESATNNDGGPAPIESAEQLASGVKPDEDFRPPPLRLSAAPTSGRLSAAEPEPPPAADLRPCINDWAAFYDTPVNLSLAPELRKMYLTGTVSNHPVLEDGPIKTSNVAIWEFSTAEWLATTRSTVYVLGVPSASYGAEMALNATTHPFTCSNLTVLTGDDERVTERQELEQQQQLEQQQLEQQQQQQQQPQSQQAETRGKVASIRKTLTRTFKQKTKPRRVAPSA